MPNVHDYTVVKEDKGYGEKLMMACFGSAKSLNWRCEVKTLKGII